MNKSTQVYGTTPKELISEFLDGVDGRIKRLEAGFQPKKPTEYLTRKEVAKMLSITLPTLVAWCKKGILKPYRCSNRVYFKRHEVEQALTEINQ